MHAKYLAQSKYTTSVGCNFDCFMIMVVVVICPPQKIQLRKRNNVKKKLGGYNRQKKKKKWLPKDVHISIPRTWEFVILHGKGLKVGIRRWGYYPGLSEWGQCNHKGSLKMDKGGRRVSEREKAENCCADGFKEGRRDHEPQNTDNSRNWKGQGNRFSPSISRRNTYILIPWF